MVKMSIVDVRKRLGTIVGIVFDEIFNAKYNSFVACEIINPEVIMDQNSQLADLFVSSQMLAISNPEYIKEMNIIASEQQVFTVFMRYHFLTCYLENQGDNIIEVEESDSAFLRQMLNSYWKLGLSI